MRTRSRQAQPPADCFEWLPDYMVKHKYLTLLLVQFVERSEQQFAESEVRLWISGLGHSVKHAFVAPEHLIPVAE
jgi:hypothetical protein